MYGKAVIWEMFFPCGYPVVPPSLLRTVSLHCCSAVASSELCQNSRIPALCQDSCVPASVPQLSSSGLDKYSSTDTELTHYSLIFGGANLPTLLFKWSCLFPFPCKLQNQLNKFHKKRLEMWVAVTVWLHGSNTSLALPATDIVLSPLREVIFSVSQGSVRNFREVLHSSC